MDQIQQDRQKIIAKLVKIKALAERGIGGEQQTAQVMYTTLKEKYKVTDAEIEKAAAVPVDISEIDLKKFWGIAFQLAAVAKTLQEETDICTACPYTYTDEQCTGCGTYWNMRDLRLDFEAIQQRLIKAATEVWQMEKEMTLGSLFDGIAGFPLAAAQNGIKTIWASEIVGDCIDIVKKHFPEIQHLGDITKINGGEIPPVDIISFGSPCQNLSTAGNQKGLDGEKSQLFFEAIRIIYEMRGATNGKYPKYIIWENVAGAFSSNKGQDFRRVLEEITKTYIPMPNSRRWATSGMVRSAAGSTAWRQLDAQYWGVPQRRKRIYLVHNFNGERAPEILFECESVLGYTAQGRTEGKNIAGSAGNSVEATGTGTAAGFLPLNSGRANGVGYEDEKSPTLTKNPPATVYTIAGNAIGRMGRNGGNQLGVGQDISYTLTAADRHAIAAPEAFRLSSFGGFAEGVGTLRASGGDNGGGQ